MTTNKAFILCVIAVASAVAVAVAASPPPPPRCSNQPCGFTATVNGTTLSYDFSALCNTDGDYLLKDAAEHNYYMNICGNAEHMCMPATWTPTHKTGVAIQSWGATPTCKHACSYPNGTAACCTADCQVLGSGKPQWSLLDPLQPQAGVKAVYKAGATSKSNPFWCTFNPTTGAQYERHITYVFLCDATATGKAIPVDVVQNNTNDCYYTATFKTAAACGCASYSSCGTCTQSGGCAWCPSTGTCTGRSTDEATQAGCITDACSCEVNGCSECVNRKTGGPDDASCFWCNKDGQYSCSSGAVEGGTCNHGACSCATTNCPSCIAESNGSGGNCLWCTNSAGGDAACYADVPPGGSSCSFGTCPSLPWKSLRASSTQ